MKRSFRILGRAVKAHFAAIAFAQSLLAISNTTWAQPGKLTRHLVGSEVIATVGDEPILASDVIPMVDDQLEARAEAKGKTLQNVTRDKLEAARFFEMKKQLQQAIDDKLLFAEASRHVSKEKLVVVRDNAHEIFEQTEVPRLIASYQVTTRDELEARLRQNDISLGALRTMFFERGVGTQYFKQVLEAEVQITRDQALAYYQEHLSDFETPTQARWEHIFVKVSDDRSKEDATQRLTQWRDQIAKGASFAEIAKAHSEHSSKIAGGLRYWTTKGSLSSEALDQAVFGLTVGTLSPIIKDERGLSLVRVLERKEATRQSFEAAHADIQRKIKEDHAAGKKKEFLAQLRAKTTIWTIFDAETNPAAAAHLGKRGTTPQK